MTTRTSRGALACALLATTCLATPALAQSTEPPPRFQSVDANGVDLVTGDFNFAFTEGSIGSGPGAVRLVRYRGGGYQGTNWTGLLYRRSVNGVPTMHVELGPIADTFTISGSTYTSTKADGATLVALGGGQYRYTAANGTRIDYKSVHQNPFELTAYPVSGPPCQIADPGTCAIPTSLTRPDGMAFSIGWDIVTKCVGGYDAQLNCLDPQAYFRFDGVTSSANYSFSTSYLTDDPGNFSAPQTNWYKKTGAAFTNLSSPPSPLPSVAYAYPASGIEEVTDSGGRTWRFTSGTGFAIRRPGSAADDIVVGFTGGVVSSVTRDGVATGYARSVAGATATMTVTDALAKQTVVVSDLNLGRPTSIKDELNRTTSFTYDGSGRLTKVTQPEGNSVAYAHDARGNVTSTRRREKGDTGDTADDIVTSAVYPSACANPKTCNQPTSTTDARGKVTNYAWDATHGGLSSVTLPAAPNGVQPQTRIGYTATGGVYLPTSISQCQTGASCAGTADEVRTTIAYGGNLLASSVSTGAGNGSLTATQSATYDPLGNLLTIDGPLAGTAHTTRLRYNAAREVVGVISPDPDGAGALKHRAVRTSYNGAGLVTKVEQGTVTSQTDAASGAFAPLEAVETVYDANDRPVLSKLSAGTTVHALTQASYDALGRFDCTAVRMNPAQFSSLPASACTPGTAGSFGPDRISRTVYDAAGQVTQQRVAVGTSIEAAEATMGYTANGQLATLTDGENNRTTYEYDVHDRLLKTRYPVSTKGANTSSTTDYEQLTYDAGGNIVSRRLRDGQMIGYGYDDLSRLTSVNLPSGVIHEYDLAYGYDNLGRLTLARDLNPYHPNGVGSTFGYDALGRLISDAHTHYGTRTFQYDIAGRRTRLTWSDGFYAAYDYNVLGDMTKIRENGATSGIGVLATFSYDDLGRRTSLVRGNGTSTTYSYDPASRLSQLVQNLVGTADDLTLGFSYNPAGQIVTNTRSNDKYAWAGHGSGTTSTPSNGLNQLTSVGGAATAYDARGNMTADGLGNMFGYTSRNLLATAPGVSLAYDALGRLYYVDGAEDVAFHYDGGNLIEERGAGAGYPILRRYVFGPGIEEPLVWYEGSGTSARYFLHADERGTIVSLSDNAGGVARINSHDEYGLADPANWSRFQFTGQVWPVRELPILDFGFRMYHPKLGRFLQTDPIGYGDGPNLYAYVKNDPGNLVDPFGLNKMCVKMQGPKSPTRDDGFGNPIVTGSMRTVCFDPDEGRFPWASSRSSGPFTNWPVPKPEPKSGREKKLPPCLQSFLKGRVKSDPSKITLHSGSPFELTENSVTFDSDIYLFGEMASRTDRSALIHKFHEIHHTSQYASGYGALNQAFAYVAFGGHDASPFEQAADRFAQDAYDAYKSAGLDKTCPF